MNSWVQYPLSVQLTRPGVLVCLLVLGSALAACGSSGTSPKVGVDTPAATAAAWFKSINDGNLALAEAHFEPGSRSQMQWSDFGSVSFKSVKCLLRSQSATSSDVRCSFTVPNPPADLEGQYFWDVYMKRRGTGPWLISTYGQG